MKLSRDRKSVQDWIVALVFLTVLPSQAQKAKCGAQADQARDSCQNQPFSSPGLSPGSQSYSSTVESSFQCMQGRSQTKSWADKCREKIKQCQSQCANEKTNETKLGRQEGMSKLNEQSTAHKKRSTPNPAMQAQAPKHEQKAKQHGEKEKKHHATAKDAQVQRDRCQGYQDNELSKLDSAVSGFGSCGLAGSQSADTQMGDPSQPMRSMGAPENGYAPNNTGNGSASRVLPPQGSQMPGRGLEIGGGRGISGYTPYAQPRQSFNRGGGGGGKGGLQDLRVLGPGLDGRPPSGELNKTVFEITEGNLEDSERMIAALTDNGEENCSETLLALERLAERDPILAQQKWNELSSKCKLLEATLREDERREELIHGYRSN